MTDKKVVTKSTWSDELKSSHQSRKTGGSKFLWGSDVATPETDTSHPGTKLGSTQKAPKTPAPASDLPRTTSGQIDNQKLKSDLVAELRLQKRIRR